jgi:hypothetical protein
MVSTFNTVKRTLSVLTIAGLLAGCATEAQGQYQQVTNAPLLKTCKPAP